jgi:hypothetical protein
VFAPILNTNLTTDKKPAVIETITDIHKDDAKIDKCHFDLVEMRPQRFMGQRAAKPVLSVPAVYATISRMLYARLCDIPF